MGDEDDDDQAEDPPARGGGTDWQARWREERRRHRLANGRITELEGELTGLRPRAQTVDALAKQLKELEAKHASDRSTWEVERAAWSAGITDPDGLLVARTLHSALPEAGRPAIGDWIQSLRADPSKAPKPLRPYLEVEDAAADEPERPAPKKRPAVNAGATDTQAAGGRAVTPPTPAEWAAAKAKLRTGDTTDFDALTRRVGIGRQLPRPKE